MHLYSDLENEAHLSKRSVMYVHCLLHRILKDAALWGNIPRNPCDLVKPSKFTRREMQVLDEVGVAAFISAARGDPLEAL